MPGLSIQDVTAVLDVHNQASEKRHDDLKEEVRSGFKKLDIRIDSLESADKPLITFKTVKWLAAVSTVATLSTYIGVMISGS